MAGKPRKRKSVANERAADLREPQALMWCAVIRQAWRDVFEVPTAADGYAERVEARAEALSFLTDETGEWAEHRAFVCGLTGSAECPNRLRERALLQMILTPPPPIEMSECERLEAERAAAHAHRVRSAKLAAAKKLDERRSPQARVILDAAE